MKKCEEQTLEHFSFLPKFSSLSRMIKKFLVDGSEVAQGRNGNESFFYLFLSASPIVLHDLR